MANKEFEVRVSGLRELNIAFRELSGGWGAWNGKFIFQRLAEGIAVKIRAKIPVGGGKTPGAAPGSVLARGSARGASIAFGGQAAPYLPWLDFGGTTGRGHQLSSSGKGIGGGAIRREWLGRPVGMGRYVYPTVTEAREETRKAMQEIIANAARAADFDVRGQDEA